MEILDYIWLILFKHKCFGAMGYQGWIVGFILATFYNGLYRTKMRRQWNLKGSLSSDYCLHLWCHQCALCQQYRQLEHQGFIVFQGTLFHIMENKISFDMHCIRTNSNVNRTQIAFLYDYIPLQKVDMGLLLISFMKKTLIFISSLLSKP